MDIEQSPTPAQKSVSPWQFKPWWCQPWSILLTGITLIGGSWLIFTKIWLTILVALPVFTWMGFFLLVWPSLMIRSGVLTEGLNQGKD